MVKYSVILISLLSASLQCATTAATTVEGAATARATTAVKVQSGLPTIWDNSELENLSQSTGSFRILSEIHLNDKSSYLLEEWLDGPNQAFRLDVLERREGDDPNGHTNGNGGGTFRAGAKKTILVRGATSERYFLEPFQCAPFENLDWALGPALGGKFPQAEAHELAIAGLGAIWLYATRANATQAKFRDATVDINDEHGGLKDKRARSRTMRAFDLFTVDEQAGFPYKIKFYFLPGQWLRPDGHFNPNALMAIHLVDPAPGSRIKMSARVIEMDTSSGRALRGLSQEQSLFELPLGYGCTRLNVSALAAGGAEYKPPRDCLDLVGSAGSAGLICNIELVTYLPIAPEDDLDKWATHTSSLRLVSGHLLGRNYLTLEERDYVSTRQILAGHHDNGLTKSRRKSALRRAKRIWDLGEAGEHAQSGTPTSPPPSTPPMYFELSEHLRVCHAYGNAQLDEVLSVEFALIDRHGEVSSSGGGATIKKLVGLSLVDEKSMFELFKDTTDFHLVRERAAPWPGYRELHHEKQVERFALRTRSGQVYWSMASLVRRWYQQDQCHMRTNASDTSAPPLAETPAEAREVRLTIYLYEWARGAYESIHVGRVQLTMSEGQLVDEAYLHRELNIEPCLQRCAADNLLLHTPLNGDHLAFGLVYPLDVPQTQVLALRADYRDAIYANFLQIFSQDKEEQLFRAQGGGLQFDAALQLSELQVDVESNLVSISGKIHKWPEQYNYIKSSATTRLSQGQGQLVMFTSELKPTSELCAQSCSHYNCPLFVYDQISRTCDLYLETSKRQPPYNGDAKNNRVIGAASSLYPLKRDSYCTVFERKLDRASGRGRGRGRGMATPRQLVEAMQSWIARELGDEDAATNPLAIKLEPAHKAGAGSRVDRLVLVPSSLRVGSDLRTKAEVLLLPERKVMPGTNKTQEFYDDDDEHPGGMNRLNLVIKSEFELVYKNRKFRAENYYHHSSPEETSEQFPLEEAASVEDQWDCELLCREHDCASYSYCQMSRKCVLSKLRTKSAIEATTEVASFCMVLAREYLSKFDKLEALVRADELGRAWVKSPAVERRLLSLDSVRDCAISCMESRDFTCRSFIVCPSQGSDCMLFGNRNALGHLQPALSGGRNETKNPKGNSTTSADETPTQCDLYQRSFLVDYQQFYGKRLDIDAAAAAAAGRPAAIRLLRGLGAEDCASMCSQTIDDDERQEACGAFHVCLNSPNNGKRHQLLCSLLVVSSSGDSAHATVGARTNVLIDEPNCSAFVPYNSSTQQRATKGNSESDMIQAGSDTNSHSLARSLLIIMIGLAIGYTLTWLIAFQNLVTYPAVLVKSMGMA